MRELVFEIESNAEIWEILDKELNTILIHGFMPNESIQWWKTDLKLKDGTVFNDLSVRQMTMDIKTDLNGLKRIIDLNSSYLAVYQFEKDISDTLTIDRIPPAKLNDILKKNGLKHRFDIHFEFITVSSFDDSFIEGIEQHPLFKERIEKRKDSLKS